MIEKITIKDFKSYQYAELKLSSLTVLIGANASGKSNALEAIRFLNWLAQGRKLSSLQYLVNENDRVVRGRIRDLPRQGMQQFGLGCDIAKEEFKTWEVMFGLRENEELHIDYEAVVNPALDGYNFLYRTKETGRDLNTQISVEYNNFARGGKKPQIDCSDQMGIFLQLESAARFADGHSKAKKLIPRIAAKIEQNLAGILFLDPVPQKMRDYSFLSEKKILGDGSNLSSVLYHVWNDDENRQKNRSALLSFIRSLPEQDISEFGFLEGPRGEVMLQLKETFGGRNRFFDAGLISDGTLRVLALAAALLTADNGSMVIIEEVDNGVHPSRVNKLLQSINEIAKEKQLTVLISSHNPALLDALPTDAIPAVVFCYRDPDSGHSRLIRMQDIPDYPELIAQDSLGDLLTRGIIERFVKQQEGTEIKKQKALSWLKTIK